MGSQGIGMGFQSSQNKHRSDWILFQSQFLLFDYSISNAFLHYLHFSLGCNRDAVSVLTGFAGDFSFAVHLKS